MKGTCKHRVLNMTNGTKFVCLSNDSKPAIWQGFESHAEIEAHIAELKKAALEAFGPSRITMRQLMHDQTPQADYRMAIEKALNLGQSSYCEMFDFLTTFLENHADTSESDCND